MGKLRVYLDTIYERATNDFFERVTLPALMSSRYLIVVATPDAAPREQATNDWMRREIEAFEAGPNRGNIILVRAAGAFAGPLPGDLAVRYPNIEIIDMRGYGPFAFLNPAKASRLADETVKIVAPLLGLTSEDMPAIRREEERRQQFRLGRRFGDRGDRRRDRSSRVRILEPQQRARCAFAQRVRDRKDDPNHPVATARRGAKQSLGQQLRSARFTRRPSSFSAAGAGAGRVPRGTGGRA
ncbi:hypothetical protein [Bradyrhizobium sp. 191]|uniref:hypothetical protein n=1 Tax=Bradyrhizobium sp. 191 TaxID=2782659 RepID=UPI001FFFE2C3|nr:hypothetical protein [Bradyrhizobium sp. 191]UPJ68596.1 hypothetical protein IVB23_15855 [Bradyrhizobium sp. 191]